MSSYANMEPDGAMLDGPGHIITQEQQSVPSYENVEVGGIQPPHKPNVVQPITNIPAHANLPSGSTPEGGGSTAYETVGLKAALPHLSAAKAPPKCTPTQAIAATKTEWYQPRLSRTGAEVVLHGQKTGRFVIRESSQTPPPNVEGIFLSLTVVINKERSQEGTGHKSSTFWNGLVLMEFLETTTRFAIAREGDLDNILFDSLDDIVLTLMTNQTRMNEFNLPVALRLP